MDYPKDESYHETLNCKLADIIRNPSIFQGRFLRVVGRVDEYDATEQRIKISDPLMETAKKFYIDTSKAANPVIFKNDSYYFFGELNQSNKVWMLGLLFLKNVSCTDPNELFEADKLVRVYLAENRQHEYSPAGTHFMDATKAYLQSTFPDDISIK